MLPSAFDYRVPSSLEEVLAILAENGDEAKVLSGGQSLIPLLKLRFANPRLVVDVGRISGLAGFRTSDGRLTIGARTRHADVEANPALRDLCPILLSAAPQISDPLVRNRGTLGGSLAHADPQGDWGAVMLALDATVVARSSGGEREIPMSGFFQGPFTTDLRPDEVLTEIRIPTSGRRASGTYLKLERKVGDFATVGVAVQVEVEDGRIAKAGIGLTAVGASNLKATRAEEALTGQVPTEDVIREAARRAADAAEPKADIRGSVAYKKDLVRIYVQRGLKTALGHVMEAGA